MECPKCGGADSAYKAKVGFSPGRWITKCWNCDYNSDTFDSSSVTGQAGVRSALDVAGIRQVRSKEEIHDRRAVEHESDFTPSFD